MSELKQETLESADIQRESLKKWMFENDKNAAFVAKNLGISQSMISSYLAEKYGGDNEKIDQKVQAFLNLQSARAARKKIIPPFIETSVAKIILESTKIVHEDGTIGALVSKAGLGKTQALCEYARREPNIIYLEIDHGYNAEALFTEINKILFGDTGYKRLHYMHVDIINKLRGSGRMIIIDQAEYLPFKALEMMRAIYDKAQIGILLAGLECLLDNIRGPRGQFAQLHSRINQVIKLSPLTMDDAKLFVASMIGEAKAEKYHASFHQRAKGNAREMVKMVNAAVRIAHVSACEINEDLIEEAENMVRF